MGVVPVLGFSLFPELFVMYLGPLPMGEGNIRSKVA
jgi:hypothetical protein